MSHLCARQRRSDNRWDYTRNGYPTGYCQEYRPIPLDSFLGERIAKAHNEKMEPLRCNFHSDGHATEEEACECYKRYMLDTQLSLRTSEPENAQQAFRCKVCNAWTSCVASVGAYQIFFLCPEHQTRECVESLYSVGESWES